MMRRLVEPAPVENRINVTPIIDVALVLVIILMITGPMLAVAELGLVLPEARTVSFADEDRINVSLDKDGRLAIGEKIVARDALVPELSAELSRRANENPVVVVRADAGIPYGVVRELLDEATAAGSGRVAFATSPPTEKMP